MPTLNEYRTDADKDGFYVRAHVGASHPVTLQVTPIASRIFNAVGYTDGDAVPTKLVWAMYDLDMLYTLSSIDIDDSPNNLDPIAVLDELDINSELTESDRAELISFLARYTGPDADRVESLKQKLLDQVSEEALDRAQSGDWFSSIADLPTSRKEVLTVLEDWTPPHLLERAHKALLLQEDFVTWSVRTFGLHSRLNETPLVQIGENELVYELEPTTGIKRTTIADARGHRRTVSTKYDTAGYDFRIERDRDDGTHETGHIKDDTVVKYTAEEGESRLTLLSYDLEKILPPRLSYFGLTADEPYNARWLTDRYLSLPREEIEQRITEFETPRDPSGTDTEKDTENRDAIAPSLTKEIRAADSVQVATVNRFSNSNNPIAKVGESSTEYVITDDVYVDEHEQIVIPREKVTEQEELVQVNNATPLGKVPSENPHEWLKEHF